MAVAQEALQGVEESMVGTMVTVLDGVWMVAILEVVRDMLVFTAGAAPERNGTRGARDGSRARGTGDESRGARLVLGARDGNRGSRCSRCSGGDSSVISRGSRCRGDKTDNSVCHEQRQQMQR